MRQNMSVLVRHFGINLYVDVKRLVFICLYPICFDYFPQSSSEASAVAVTRVASGDVTAKL